MTTPYHLEYQIQVFLIMCNLFSVNFPLFCIYHRSKKKKNQSLSSSLTNKNNLCTHEFILWRKSSASPSVDEGVCLCLITTCCILKICFLLSVNFFALIKIFDACKIVSGKHCASLHGNTTVIRKFVLRILFSTCSKKLLHEKVLTYACVDELDICYRKMPPRALVPES